MVKSRAEEKSFKAISSTDNSKSSIIAINHSFKLKVSS